MSTWKNTFGTTAFVDFNMKFFATLGMRGAIHYFNKKVVIHPKGKINIEIILDDVGTHDHFNGYCVTIIHKVNGKLTSEWFPFSSYLTSIDTESVELVAYVVKDWYRNGPTPESIISMVDKICEYISLYI